MFNKRQPKPEHLEKFMDSLKPEELVTLQEIVKRSGLSLTAVTGAVDDLQRQGKIKVIRQNKTPKVQIGLPDYGSLH